jgi:3' terminal RNA ribose 2'-O-methyltransferase Hen1
LLPEEELSTDGGLGKIGKTPTSEEVLEKPLSLNESRYRAVLSILKEAQAKRVLDVGCGDGKLLRYLLEEKSFDEIVGLDVSYRALEIAAERLKLERLPDKVREKIKLMHGSLTYRDTRLEGFAAACVIEVIEHLDEARLGAFERVLFEFARPGVVIVTTPNSEYNIKFEGLPAGKLRHPDHRFEWTRGQFNEWCDGIAARFDYSVKFQSVGDEDADLGSPTQMAVFTK